MHLAYLEQSKELYSRRNMLRGATGLFVAGAAAPLAAQSGPPKTSSAELVGPGGQSLAAAEKWIDAFFNEGSQGVAAYYADDFVFEDIILNQVIDTREELLRAFEPFDNGGPDSPLGIHQFDIVRFNGGRRCGQANQFATEVPAGFDAAIWDEKSAGIRAGGELDFDEWAIMHWLWKVQHNADFLGMPAKGKTTHIRGVTHHLYNDGLIVREYSYWNYRDIAIQLGALPEPKRMHELSSE